MVRIDGSCRMTGYATIRPGCDITAEVNDDQVIFGFGGGSDLELVLQDGAVVEKFHEEWTKARAQVAAWLAEREKDDSTPEPGTVEHPRDEC
jgi:hypothetical protein